MNGLGLKGGFGWEKWILGAKRGGLGAKMGDFEIKIGDLGLNKGFRREKSETSALINRNLG